jgi:hypothetical protein
VAVGGSGSNYGSVGYGYLYTDTDHRHTYSVADFASQISFDQGGFTFKTAPFGATGADVNFSSAMVIKQNGRVGINVTSPEGKLHVKGCAYFGNHNENSQHRVAIGGSGGNYGSVGYGYLYSGVNNEHTYSVTDFASQLRFDEGGFSFYTAPSGAANAPVVFTRGMVIKQNGNVGIGSSNPDAKLTVKGVIHAEEVRVDLTVPGPDYVFEADYDLPTLPEIQTYIKANKHLPEIPSAKQMAEEGLNLKEMNILLLKKVEELTLYLIDLNARDQQREAEIKKLTQEIASLKNK